MDSHGQSLVQDEGSAEISSLVKIQRLAERIAEVHSSDEPRGDPQMEALNAEVNIQMFQHELQEWRDSTSPSIRNLRMLILNSLCEVDFISFRLCFNIDVYTCFSEGTFMT
jgi:hypothetical protein